MLNNIIILSVVVPYPLPERPSFSIIDLELRQINFSWSPVAPDCPAIHYNILASNCGSCLTTTNHTMVTCTDVLTDGSTCAFAIRTVVCGNTTGNVSDEARGVFKGISSEIL